MDFRYTSQFLMPAEKPACRPGSYDIYPAFDIGENKIARGILPLAGVIENKDTVILDGYAGIFFDEIRLNLDSELREKYGRNPLWIDCSKYLKAEGELNRLLSPSLGGNDPLFGKRTDLSLSDYFEIPETGFKNPGISNQPLIIYGVGAALFSSSGFLVYFDLPRNELQFRARAGTVTNIGMHSPSEPKQMYKRFYFTDWIVLNSHKKEILKSIDILADGQRPDDIVWMHGDDFRKNLQGMRKAAIRPRPWFEPGAWGGNWIKEHIPGVNTEVPNYAWSFELITPENGLLFLSSGLMLEFSFDFLMFAEAEAVLGDCHKRFGTEFPIRFDFLDTFDGGNLSLQCHPRPGYMKKHFGEDFTQEESYYILDAKEDAIVYLGFTENAGREEFREALEESEKKIIPFPAEKYVQTHPASRHDLFLIPYGTIHGSGRNNLVLEISTTPYIFTFKMYDWLRPDLDGKPRPLNIERGMENLYFDRRGIRVKDELVSKPELIQEGKDWKLYLLPTHPSQLYGIMRYHFRSSVEIAGGNKCHVLSLVEGRSICVIPGGGKEQRFSYAETFIVPASVRKYRVVNESDDPVILVIAYVK